MPRKLRKPKLRTLLTLDALSLHDLLCFLAGWHPPTGEFERSRSRWETFDEFDSEYKAIRLEFLAQEWARAGEMPFAEGRYQARQAGPPGGG